MTDTERLMWLMRDIDGFVGLSADKYEYATDVALEYGHDEPTKADEEQGMRMMIDDAMLLCPENVDLSIPKPRPRGLGYAPGALLAFQSILNSDLWCSITNFEGHCRPYVSGLLCQYEITYQLVGSAVNSIVVAAWTDVERTDSVCMPEVMLVMTCSTECPPSSSMSSWNILLPSRNT